MLPDSGNAQRVHRFDRYDCMSHRRKSSGVGSDTGSDVKNAGLVRRNEMHDGLMVILKRDFSPLFDERLCILRVAFRAAYIDGHHRPQVSVFREVCQIVTNAVPPTECLKLAVLGQCHRQCARRKPAIEGARARPWLFKLDDALDRRLMAADCRLPTPHLQRRGSWAVSRVKCNTGFNGWGLRID